MKKMPSDGMLNVPEGSSIDNLQLKQLQSQYCVERNSVNDEFQSRFFLSITDSHYGAKKTAEETDSHRQTEKEAETDGETKRQTETGFISYDWKKGSVISASAVAQCEEKKKCEADVG